MGPTDLMIGDWVLRFGEVPSTVEAIGNVEVYLSDDWRLTYEHIKPIPLTNEILEKNGFGYIEKDEYSGIVHYYPGEKQFCANMDFHIGTNQKGVYWLNYLGNTIRGIRYVHELQHAFHLCGIEKDIII